MKIIHTADVHLGMSFSTASFAKDFGKEKRKAILKNMVNIISYCEKEKADILLIAGDLFEGDTMPIKEVQDIAYHLGKLSHTKVFICAGNHDPKSEAGTIYSYGDWKESTYIFTKNYETMIFEDFTITSVSWKDKGPMILDKKALEIERQKIKEDEENKEKKHILMLHGDVYTKNDYLYLDTKMLSSLGYDYIALGHIHKKDIINDLIVYPGSPEPLDFSETGEHGFIEVNIEDYEERRKKEIKFIPSMIHEMKRIEHDITKMNSIAEIEESLQQKVYEVDKQAMLRVEIVGEKDVPVETITKGDIQLHEVAYYEIKDKSTPSYDIEKIYEEYKDGIIGRYIDYVRNTNKKQDIKEEALRKGVFLMMKEQGRNVE